MMQMTFDGLLLQTTQIPVMPTADVPIQKTRLIYTPSDLVDVSETAQDAGIPYKITVTGELYERLRRCHPGDPYENEVVLWDVLWLTAFERTLNAFVPAFAFAATIPCANGGNETIRLRYLAGDPAVIEIAR
jgi:hypothetical protein